MSKVKIEGNASGTGTFTIAAPNSNTDRSITLPDAAGELLLANGDGSSLTGISAGITEADQWQLTTAATHNSGYNYFTANLARSSSAFFGKLGTGMSESSGVFTFPSTGYWLISTNAWYYYTSATVNAARFGFQTSTNGGSSFSDGPLGSNAIASGQQGSVSHTCLVDITDTSTHKIRFYSENSSGPFTVVGGSGAPNTWFGFYRLGDT